LNENSNAALAFIWDTNKKALKVFVDGVMHQTITQYVSRAYWSLNFNPI
jgi:pyridoxine/pyridoxamine 5'-phosphate oxidase